MITNQYKQMLKYLISGGSAYGTTPIVDNNGTSRVIYQGFPLNFNSIALRDYYTMKYADGGSSSICFGTGTNAESANDYGVTGNTVSSLSLVSCNGVSSIENNKITSTVNIVINNTGNEDKTVTEMGLFFNFKSASSDGSGSYKAGLAYRKLFDTPITFVPNTPKQFTFTFETEVV